MKEENFIHVKLEYEEAIQSKRDLLSSERDIIKLLKTIKRYHLLRKKELDVKLNICRRIKELKSNLTRLNQTLPKIKVPEILKREEHIMEISSTNKKEFYDRDLEPQYDRDLESQLQEIQDRLRRLG